MTLFLLLFYANDRPSTVIRKDERKLCQVTVVLAITKALTSLKSRRAFAWLLRTDDRNVRNTASTCIPGIEGCVTLFQQSTAAPAVCFSGSRSFCVHSSTWESIVTPLTLFPPTELSSDCFCKLAPSPRENTALFAAWIHIDESRSADF